MEVRQRHGRRRWLGLALVAGLLWIDVGLAAVDEPAEATAPKPPAAPAVDTRVAATVNGVPITVCEVQREVRRVLPGGETPAGLKQWVQAKALQQLIDRQLVVKQLARTQIAATDKEVDLIWQRLVRQMTERKSSIADHLRQAGLDEPAMRRLIGWQLTWDRYLQSFITDENLEKYFEKNRREFDGSQVRVAHVLIKAGEDPAQLEAALKKAKEIRAELVDGKLTFADAAARFSAAPTAKTGGDIGFIGRRDPMPESFSRVAFSLQLNQVSEPVVSTIGVHLIQCLEIKPGQRTWRDARQEVDAALTQYLFEWLASRERPEAKIEVTGVVPSFAPGTEELVGTKSE